MAAHRPTDLTEHAAPPFPPHSPDPEHESKLSRRSSISRIEDAIKGVFFGNARINKHAVDEHVHAIQQRDEDFHAKITTPHDSPNAKQTLTESGQRSPSVEARQAEITNQNGFSDDKEYGWPGLGSWQSASRQNEQKQPIKPAQTRRGERIEAAMDEAIDESADESYGWPGLGSWPSSKRT